MRASYEAVRDYKPDPGCLVEIGSERGGGSTAYLYRYAEQNRLKFYTVELDPNVYRHIVRNYDGAVHARGLDFLNALKDDISIAYLDGFDWVYQYDSEITRIQKEQYEAMGLELTHENSQQEHLQEAVVVDQKSSPRSLIIFDDTYVGNLHNHLGWPGAQDRTGLYWTGKGGTAVPYLVEQGYEVIDSVESKAVLYRDKS